VLAYRTRSIEMANRFNVPDFDPDRDQPTAQMRHELGEPPLTDLIPRAANSGKGKGNGFILGTRPFDPNKAGDVELAKALAREYPPRPTLVDEAADAALFADDDEDEVQEPPRRKAGKKQTREPVEA
jgi:hypothetical protein